MDAAKRLNDPQKYRSQPAPTSVSTPESVTKIFKRHDLIADAYIKQQKENKAIIVQTSEPNDSNNIILIKQEQNDDDIMQAHNIHESTTQGQYDESTLQELNDQAPTTPKLDISMDSMGVPLWMNSPPYDDSSIPFPPFDWMHQDNPTPNQIFFSEAVY